MQQSTVRYLASGALGAALPIVLRLGPTGPGFVLAALVVLGAAAVGWSFGADLDSRRLGYAAGRRHGFVDGWDRAMAVVDARQAVVDGRLADPATLARARGFTPTLVVVDETEGRK